MLLVMGKKKTHQTLSLGRGPYFQTSNASGLIISPEFGKAFRKRKPRNREIDPWLSVTQQQQQKSQVKSKLILNFFSQGSSIAKFPKGRLCWLILSSLLAQFLLLLFKCHCLLSSSCELYGISCIISV